MAQSTSTPLVAPTAQAVIARRDWTSAALIGVAILVFASLLIGAGIDKLLSLAGQGFGTEYLSHYALWWRSTAWALSGGTAWPEAVPAYWRLVMSWTFAGKAQVIGTLALAFSAAGALAGWCALAIAKPRDPHVHVRGRQIWRGEQARAAARQASREKCAISKPELRIHDDIVVALHQAFQSFMVMGAQGGGKTQILWRFLLSLIHRGWKTVIFDLAKGDYTISTPGVHRLFALGDARSSVWAIWRDVKSLADAESFARGLITESSDPMWSNAARGVVVAMLMRLINERGQSWGWKDLGETTFADLVEIKEFAKRHYPPALAAVADAESKTTQSIHINLMAYLAPLYRFCEEWSDLPENFTAEWTRERFKDEKPGDEKQDEGNNGRPRAFSWIEWLEDDASRDRTIVLQSNAKDKTSAVALIRAMMEVQVSHIASLEFSESKTRRIFYMLDELPQVGRLECLTTILEVGRSKGCAIGMAFQDIAQPRQINKEGEDDKWLAMLGIRIFAQVKGGASAKFVLDQIGAREVERPTTSVTTSSGGYSVSKSWQRTELQVMTAEELEKLGPQPQGVNAIVLGHSADVLELNWPYYSPTVRRRAKVARLAVIPNAPKQVNGIEAKAESASLDHMNQFKRDSEPVNNPIKNASLENAAIPESRVSTYSSLETAPEFIEILENTETEADQDKAHEQEGWADQAADEIAQHVISEAVSEMVGASPEAVEAGLMLLDELSGGGSQDGVQTTVVLTPAHMRKARQREREAAK